jgi:hypothetical protein
MEFPFLSFLFFFLFLLIISALLRSELRELGREKKIMGKESDFLFLFFCFLYVILFCFAPEQKESAEK